MCENGQQKKKEKTSSIAVDEPCLHVLTNNNNNNLRNEKKQETKEKTQNDSLAFVTTFLEWLFFSTATTYYYLQTKTNIVVPHTIISRGFSLSLSIQFFLPLYGGSRRINACIIVLYKVVVQKLVANRSSSLVCTMLLLLLHYTLYIYIYIYCSFVSHWIKPWAHGEEEGCQVSRDKKERSVCGRISIPPTTYAI